MAMTIKDGTEVAVDDYHDFYTLQKQLQQICMNGLIQVKEVRFDENTGKYIGIISEKKK